MKNVQHNSGFTLMELVIVMAIISIVAVMTIPNASDYVDNNRLSAAASDMAAALQTARSEAVGRNAPITMCASNAAGNKCRSGFRRWENGWLIFVDQDDDDTIDSGEEVLQFHEALRGNLTMRGTQGVAPITFFPSGRTSLTSTQELIICDHRGFGDDAKGLVVSILGRASIMSAKSTNQTSCIPP